MARADDRPIDVTNIANDVFLKATFVTLTGTLPAGSYQGVISDTVRDLAGNTLSLPVTWAFDVVPPVRWIDPSGGSWNSGNNWSTGVAPGPDDVVIIDLPGNYLINTFAATVKSIHIVNPDAAIRHRGNAFTVLGDYINEGKINVDSNSISATTARLIVNGTLINNGEIEINQGGNREGSRRISADILNNGLIDINKRAYFEKDGGELINAGIIDIVDGQDLLFNGALATFSNDGGTLQNTGEMQISGGSTFNLTTGVISDTLVTVWDGDLNLSAEVDAANATVQLRSNPGFYAGDIPAGLTVNFFYTTITVPNGFTNYGTLNLGLNQSGAEPTTNLDVLAGEITNRGTMLVRGDANRVTVSADLTNYGLLDVASKFTFDLPESTIRNLGVIDLADNPTLNAAGSLYLHEGGTLQNTGTFNINGGATVNLLSGAINDATIAVNGGHLMVNDAVTALNGTVKVLTTPSSIDGVIPAGLTAELYWTTITTTVGLTNYGTLFVGLNRAIQRSIHDDRIRRHSANQSWRAAIAW